MTERHPNLVVIGGPNGAGKSTSAPSLLRDTLAVTEFVNADVLARGLSEFDPRGSAVAAGRIMLARVRELARRRIDFAFESTLASRSLAGWISDLKEDGYEFRLVFVWLRSPDLALARIQRRVLTGGHDVPEEIVRRRYARGARNLFELYMPLAETWKVYDNSDPGGMHLVAAGGQRLQSEIHDEEVWGQLQRTLTE